MISSAWCPHRSIGTTIWASWSVGTTIRASWSICTAIRWITSVSTARFWASLSFIFSINCWLFLRTNFLYTYWSFVQPTLYQGQCRTKPVKLRKFQKVSFLFLTSIRKVSYQSQFFKSRALLERTQNANCFEVNYKCITDKLNWEYFTKCIYFIVKFLVCNRF